MDRREIVARFERIAREIGKVPAGFLDELLAEVQSSRDTSAPEALRENSSFDFSNELKPHGPRPPTKK